MRPRDHLGPIHSREWDPEKKRRDPFGSHLNREGACICEWACCVNLYYECKCRECTGCPKHQA